ncbi:hypothetical protein [Thermoleptolyngbya sp.]
MTAETIYQNTLLKRFLKTSPPNDLARLLWQMAGEMVAEKLRLTLPQNEARLSPPKAYGSLSRTAKQGGAG